MINLKPGAWINTEDQQRYLMRDSEEKLAVNQFEVIVAKTQGRTLGIDIKTKSCIVSKINPGLVADWNAQHADKRILIGQRIVSVNGVRGDPKKIAAALKME